MPQPDQLIIVGSKKYRPSSAGIKFLSSVFPKTVICILVTPVVENVENSAAAVFRQFFEQKYPGHCGSVKFRR
jgi:hypothetical protein